MGAGRLEQRRPARRRKSAPSTRFSAGGCIRSWLSGRESWRMPMRPPSCVPTCRRRGRRWAWLSCSANRPGEALDHLRPAVAGNPLDRAAARACFQALNTVGDAEGTTPLIEEQRDLWQACPSLVPAEAWFSPPRPKGNELASIIILCCNQLEYTRQCLESVLRHTREPYELVLVDNGSSDGTLALPGRDSPPPPPGADGGPCAMKPTAAFPAGCNQAWSRPRASTSCSSIMTPS